MPFLSGSPRAAALVALIAISCGERSGATVSVAAAASLRDVLLAIEEDYERAHPGVDLEFSFAASSSHARQIAAGAEFDVFLSADAVNVERVRDALAGDTRRGVLRNRLVLAMWEGSPPLRGTSAPSARSLRDAEGAIAVGGPSVPVGRYARAFLAENDLLEALEPRFVNAPNARAVVALVASGAARFGFVYESDRARAEGVLWLAPATPSESVEYEGVALARAPETARAFLAWLVAPEFQARAVEFGFVPVAEVER